MNTIKSTVERQFSNVAEKYRTSAVHAGGVDLVEMVKAANLTGERSRVGRRQRRGPYSAGVCAICCRSHQRRPLQPDA